MSNFDHLEICVDLRDENVINQFRSFPIDIV
jgi:hypothetical protein